MTIRSNIATEICTDMEQYKAALARHTAVNNEIWISPEGVNYPCLALLIKGKDACVHFFEDDEGQFASVGDMEQEDSILFEVGQYEVAAYQVVSLRQAMDCALEFYDGQALPACIDWEEL